MMKPDNSIKMKKLFFLMAAMATMFLSCGKDDDFKPAEEEDGDVKITLQVKSVWMNSDYGYHMLLDSRGTALALPFGAIDWEEITGEAMGILSYLCAYSTNPFDIPTATPTYAKYDYKIPTGAQPDADKISKMPSVVAGVSESIFIDAGTYDYVIAYPYKDMEGALVPCDPETGAVVANAYGDGYTFEYGYEYIFKCDLNATTGVPSVTLTKTRFK